MIDLSPQPQDKGSTSGTAPSTPRHDPLQHPAEPVRSRWLFTHEEAEAGIQRVSRWAGPVALLVALILFGWWIIY